jgi:hypothetical protein
LTHDNILNPTGFLGNRLQSEKRDFRFAIKSYGLKPSILVARPCVHKIANKSAIS